MKEWEIWIEGYAATGEHARACFQGKAEAESFDEACIELLGDRLDKTARGALRRGSYRENLPPGIELLNCCNYGGNFTIWGCQLFPTEEEARKSFG